MIEEWVLLTGAFTGTVAVATSVRSGLRKLRERRRRSDLIDWLQRLLRIERRLSALAADLDDKFVQGVTSSERDVWPVQLRGHAFYLADLVDEAERAEAAVRAMDTEGALERLRADVEQLYVVFRTAADEYLRGAQRRYRASHEQPTPVGAAADEGVAMLDADAAERVRALRANFMTLTRSCLYRLGNEGHAEALEVCWPIARRDVAAAHELNVWSTEPRPISHEGLG